jgi:protein-S-isoprenylcysteine O-methyltransferase Ste14
MSVSASSQPTESKACPVPWRRLGDIGLCFILMLFAFIRALAAWNAAQQGDALAAVHHIVVGLSMLIMSILPVIRRSAVARGEGLLPKVVATIAGYIIIPLGLLPLTWRPDWLLTVTTLGLIAGALFEIWALLTLKRSFSVFPEARKLVTHGPYGLVRHPLYAVYLVTYVLVAAPRIGPLAVLLAAVGIAGQMMRARREEEVLRRAFPEYDDYAARVPRYLPRLGRVAAPVARPATAAVATDDRDEALAA